MVDDLLSDTGECSKMGFPIDDICNAVETIK